MLIPLHGYFVFGELRFPDADAPFIPGNARRGLVPVEIPLSPDVREPDQENGEKNEHLDKGEPSETLIDRRPREEEDHFDVEDEEDEGNDIEADVQSDAGVSNGGLPALVGGILAWVRAMRAQQPGGKESDRHKPGTDDEEKKYSTEFGEHREWISVGQG